jgi:hypothetical protein
MFGGLSNVRSRSRNPCALECPIDPGLRCAALGRRGCGCCQTVRFWPAGGPPVGGGLHRQSQRSGYSPRSTVTQEAARLLSSLANACGRTLNHRLQRNTMPQTSSSLTKMMSVGGQWVIHQQEVPEKNSPKQHNNRRPIRNDFSLDGRASTCLPCDKSQ